jgi:hypothetical protein
VLKNSLARLPAAIFESRRPVCQLFITLLGENMNQSFTVYPPPPDFFNNIVQSRRRRRLNRVPSTTRIRCLLLFVAKRILSLVRWKGAISMKFGIHNPSWVFGPDRAEAAPRPSFSARQLSRL